jgi:hypothetical protein
MEHYRARNTDPITSWQAADEAKDLAKAHAALILKTLQEQGPLGKDGIAYFAILDATQVARRLPEMEKEGFVELTGKFVKSHAGRAEREWCFIKESK